MFCAVFMIWSSIAILKCLSFVVSVQDMNKHSSAVRTVWFPSLTTQTHTHAYIKNNNSMLSLLCKEMKITCKHCNRFEISDSNIRKPINCFIWFWLKIHLFNWSWITRWWILIRNYFEVAKQRNYTSPPSGVGVAPVKQRLLIGLLFWKAAAITRLETRVQNVYGRTHYS